MGWKREVTNRSQKSSPKPRNGEDWSLENHGGGEARSISQKGRRKKGPRKIGTATKGKGWS